MGGEMGNNNTSGLREEESSKFEDNGRSPVEFLGDKGKGSDDKETDSLSNCHEGKDKTQNGTHRLDESPETEQQLEESDEQKDDKHSSAELKLSELNGPESVSATVDHLLEPRTSVIEGEHDSSEPETDNVGTGLIKTEAGEETLHVDDDYDSRSFHESVSTDEKTVKEERESQEENVSEGKFDVRDEISAGTEDGNEEKLCVDDVYASKSFHGSVSSEETDEKTVEETLLCEEKFGDKGEISAERQKDTAHEALFEEGFSKEQPEIQNLEDNQEAKLLENDHLADVLVDADEEECETVDELIKQEIKPMDQKRSFAITHYRSQSLPVRLTNRFLTDSFVQPPENRLGGSSQSEITCVATNKTGLKKGEAENVLEVQTAEYLSVHPVISNEAQEATETKKENTTEAVPRTRSPSFGSDLRIEARTDELSEETPLLYEDKAETYEEKTVMLEKNDSAKSRKEFLGFLKEKEDTGTEEITIITQEQEEKKKKFAEDEETEGLGDNLRDKKVSLGAMKGKERRRRRSSLFNTCLCCATVVN